jgi:hypothetical protein
VKTGIGYSLLNRLNRPDRGSGGHPGSNIPSTDRPP